MPTLVTIPFSHFCEKARWALDRARVVYREEGHVPGLHRRAVQRAAGKSGSVPVLVLDGEGVLDDSALIVRWADARASSDRKLLPAGGRERDEALALEHHLDVDFAPHVRRFAFYHLLPDRRASLELMRVATPRLEHAIVRAGFPVMQRLMQRTLHIDEEHTLRSRDKMRLVFDELSKRLADGRPYLMGDRFGAVDIAFSAFAAALFAPPEHPLIRQLEADTPSLLVTSMARAPGEVSALRETGAGRFALRIYREHRLA